MKFRTRIFIVYSVFVLSVTILLGGLFYFTSVQRTVRQELQDMDDLSRQLSQRYEESIKSMKNMSHYVLSDFDALQAIRKLSSFPSDTDYMSLYFSDSAKVVRDLLNTDYILRNFYRIIYFNANGVVISTIHEERKLDSKINMQDLPWLDRMKSVGYGEFAIIGLHEDDWGEKRQEVFSVVKQVQGDNLGYIEVQRTAGDLQALFEISNPDVKVILLGPDGSILFSNTAYAGDAGYGKFLEQDSLQASRYRNTLTGNDEFLAANISQETGMVVIVAKQYDTIKEDLRYIFTITITFACSFIAFAVIYILATSNHLTKPIQQLKFLMEKTNIDNIAEDVGLKTSNNEIELLRQSYEKMLKRLDSAIIKEKRITAMQFQAQFDALQAQVNPHFIYNILNVISSRGALNEDDLTCEICDGLASMLRYSTNIRSRYATVRQEAEYLEVYMKLLKCRYEHKLDYQIALSPQIMEYVLPKIVIQQLVENSVSHGYENSVYQTMCLEVSGGQNETGWYIRIRDNGEGFSDEALARIRREMESLKQQIGCAQKNIELEIGGMGIANTFARLYLLYADRLVFRVDNYAQGAEVFFTICTEGE